MSETTAPVIAPTTHNKRSAWKPVAAAGIGGAVLIATGFGVFAQLSATAISATPQAVTSGDLKLVLAADRTAAGVLSAGFDQAVNNLAPADTVNRLVTVTMPGSLDGQLLTLKVTDATPTLLSTDATRGLQITVLACAQPWTTAISATPNAVAPSCAATGGSTVALAKTALSALGTAAPVSATLTAGATTNHFLVTVLLPEQTENSLNGAVAIPASGTGSIQKLAASLTYTFSDVQRSAVNVNS